MNVTCPQCASVFRVDPAKVPERGVRARCSVCSGLISVRRPTAATAPAVPATPSRSPIAPPPPRAEPAEPQAIPVEVEAPAPAQPPSPAPEAEVEPAVAPIEEHPDVASPPPPALPPVAPLPPPPPPPPPAQSRTPSAGRFNNPFLQQDPTARARRLARALISDLVVYHPDKRQRGLAEGNLKELFGEEIRKSWEEYAEQVGEDIANTTPYFTDALNEILAEGRKMFG